MNTNLGSGKTSIFNTNTVDEEIKVINNVVVPFSTALTAAKEFFTSLEMSRCLEWFEL